MAEQSQPAARGRVIIERTDREHIMRIGVIWLVLTVIGTVLVYFVWGPHMPPGTDSDQARSQQFDNRILGTIAVPVILFIWVYFGYVLTNWRVRADTPLSELEDGPPIRGHVGFQAGWLALTTVTVLGLFVFGTIELVADSGAGTGSGQAPIWTPAGYSQNVANSKLLVVQVIGQQWRWTFRYPQYGGIESAEMVIPQGKEVQFSVTSLDVIHSFWAVNLGVKADANPGVENVAFGKASTIGPIDIRCAELCGLWHGAMFTTGHVVSADAFATWIGSQNAAHYQVVPYLPGYAPFYLPQADGGYYDPGQDPLPNPPGAVPNPTPSVVP